MKLVKLKEYCDVLSGFAFKSSLFNQDGIGIPLIRIRDLKNQTTETYYSGEYDEIYRVFPNDILISMDGEFKASRWHGPISLLNQRVSKLIKKSNKDVDLDYVYYLLNGELKKIEQQTGFTTVKHLSKSDIENITFPLPPIEYQTKIALVLKTVEVLIQKRKQAIAKLDELEQSYFLELHKEIQKSNKPLRSKMGNFIEFITSGSRGWAQYFSEVGELFITIKNVRKGELHLSDVTYVNAPKNKEAERTKVRERDLLISITADLGRTAVVDRNTAEKGAYINQHLCLVRLDFSKLNPFYVSFFLESHLGRKQLIKLDQVGVKSGLNFNAIKSIEIDVPDIQVQNEFETNLLEIRRQKQIMQSQLAKLEQNFQNLLHQAFTGKLQFATERETIAVKR